MMQAARLVTAEELRSRCVYEPETGVVRNRQTGRPVGYRNSKGYLFVQIGEARYRAHRLAWMLMTGEWPAQQIDHINNDKTDNRWLNLRLANNQQNSTNKPKRGGRYKGVYAYGAVWRARIGHNYRSIDLGGYGSVEAAARAYDRAAIELHGAFASLNFPEAK